MQLSVRSMKPITRRLSHGSRHVAGSCLTYTRRGCNPSRLMTSRHANTAAAAVGVRHSELAVIQGRCGG